MATPGAALKTCTLNVNVFSGARTPLTGTEILLTARNGNQETVPLPDNGFFQSAGIRITGLPFFDNFGDNYAVIASADGYQQAGFYPVTADPARPAVVDIMLLKNDAGFNFRNAGWSRLSELYPQYAALLRAGAADDASAGDRYGQLMETRPDVLACYFNLVTAMSQIQLPVQTPLDYIRELIWDDTMQQDRFFAWADPALIDQVIQAAAQGEFSPEVGTALFHSGATRSWKQIQFGEANVQLTFHENNRKTIHGVECVMVEPDIDYYKDLAAHALLEVITNAVTHSLSDPRQVYVLRWIAGRHAGIPNFEPPYTIE
ncbi:MAG TPA: carboxypeptidase-like regulatory domain-containing protein [Bryobacteraceae bacterium]|nr:carboxypeptidase-like regulatory domain-containing protein [Bryobacteraceae bacterium]